MTTLVPSYYPAFNCIAGDCRHSCCVGWDIGIDPITKARYDQLDSPLGERLRAAMSRDEDGDTYMTMTENGRCPFLNADGLCDIILAEGEQALCQICADHPRYRSFFSDRVEMGLGACCEEAARLMLSQTEPMRLVPLGNADALNPTAEEAAFFAQRDALLTIAQDRSRPMHQRLDAILEAVDKARPPLSRRAMFGVYSSLERLDPAWNDVLARLLTDSSGAAVSDGLLEQWLCYGLYRHTPDSLKDGAMASRTAMVVHSVRLIEALCREGTFAEVAELVRAYSAEAEYSPDNMEQLINTF